MAEVAPVKAGWYNALRPWTLHGAIVPISLAGIVAIADANFSWAFLEWVIFILALTGGILLQSAANLLNTYGDFQKGTDTEENHSRSPELVTGELKPKHVRNAGFLCVGVVALIGLVLIWYSGWWLLAIGIAGMIGVVTYTLGTSYKYMGLGQISTFLLMGILMPIGTYYTMTGTFAWEIVLLGLPNAFTITGVLAGNETRDYHSDKIAGAHTMSGYMSYENALRYYRTINVMCYPILAVILLAHTVPYTCVLAFVALIDYSKLWKNSKKAPTNKKSSFMLVPKAFDHNWHFGALLAIGYLIGVGVPWLI